MLKLIDFWAEWCVDPQTSILLSNGLAKPAGKITTQDTLLSLNINDLEAEPRRVAGVRVFKEKPSFRLTLETGRTLVADENHLVYTRDGWQKITDLSDPDFVLVDPAPLGQLNIASRGRIILKMTKDRFSNRQLEKLGLLPLQENQANLPVVARLVGALMTDGYLYQDKGRHICETHFSLGTTDDVTSLLRDLKELGFRKPEVKREKKEQQIDGRKFTQTVYRVRVFEHAFFHLFESLGVPVGRKKSQAYTVPAWIKRSPDYVKKEFLSGWLGGDGCKISARTTLRQGKRHEYTSSSVNAIEFHKEKNLEKSGLDYARDLGFLFEQFGVGVNKIFSELDEDGVIVSLQLDRNYPSLLNLSKVGYAYAATKQRKSSLVGEFLSYRLRQRDIYSRKQELVSVLSRRGFSVATIAEETGFSQDNVVNVRFKQRHGLPFGLPQTGEAIYDSWLAERLAKNGLLYEQVLKVEELGSRNVVGISVDLPHTLITNGIVSHNCGPCKMMNPIIEELEKEMVGKVEFEEVNVDENNEKSSQYGVLSIPTYVLEKDGQEVARLIGARPKEEFITLFQKYQSV